VIGRTRRGLAHALDRRFGALHRRVEDLAHVVAELAQRYDVQAAREQENADALGAIRARLDDEISPALRIMAGADAENRRLLDEARKDPDYELAFQEAQPLVTVILPTFRRAELLRTRALPAILGQTHEQLEVLVIGDGPDPDAQAAVEETDDVRVRWLSLTQRYVYPDEHRHWQAASTLTRNEGYRAAKGRWLFDFDDDDSLPPDAVERLLEIARERRLEAVQGAIRHRLPDGTTRHEVPVPPDCVPLKGALVHAHLHFFAREHVASAFGVPGDWFRGERMIRAGVRLEVVDVVAYDYYPSTLWL
jgi:hypothetical protein